MKVYSWYIGKILAKININEHILPIFLINLTHILAKTIIYKGAKNKRIWKLYVRFPLKKNYFDQCTKSNMLNLFKWSWSQFLFSWNIVSNLLNIMTPDMVIVWIDKLQAWDQQFQLFQNTSWYYSSPGSSTVCIVNTMTNPEIPHSTPFVVVYDD